MKIVLTGATGFIGKSLVVELARGGHEVTMLVRSAEAASDLPGRPVTWSSDDSEGDSESRLDRALLGADAVIHLAGHPIAEGRWTPKVKRDILNSRVRSTQKIVEALGRLPVEGRPRTFVCGSAIGFYGSRGDEILTEASAPGEGFLADVVRAWESEALRAEAHGVRVIRLRTGVVLGRDGGALKKMKPVGLGSGDQWISWIHLEDVLRFIVFSLEQPRVSGAFNLVSPEPVRNSDFTRAFATSRHQSVRFHVPEFALKAALGEMSHVVLDSVRVMPERVLQSGFKFKIETLENAFHQVYDRLMDGDERFSAVQFVPRSVEDVFDFFSRAENLETLTPPWLNFRILGKTTPEVRDGTLIDYGLKIHGVPVRWQSRIESWRPNEAFVDTQTRGPYSKWHHTHRFERVPGGTLVLDDVIYRVPGGPLGRWLGGLPIRKDIEKIFSYRKKKISEVFK